MNSFILTNGIKVLHKEITDNPLVSAQLFFRAGSVNEKETEAGLANFTQVLLMQGTGSRNSEKLARDIEAAKAVTINQISNRNATPDETEYFVPQFIACTLVCDRAFSSGNAPALEEPEDFDEVIINEIVDIGIIATCAGTNSWRIRQLNPALRSWCTPPNYPNFKLRIPHGTKKKFIAALAAVPDRNPSPGYIKYVVAKGECVNDIAKKFQTSVWSIKKANRLVNIKNIKTGETLMVRPGKEYFTR